MLSFETQTTESVDLEKLNNLIRIYSGLIFNKQNANAWHFTLEAIALNPEKLKKAKEDIEFIALHENLIPQDKFLCGTAKFIAELRLLLTILEKISEYDEHHAIDTLAELLKLYNSALVPVNPMRGEINLSNIADSFDKDDQLKGILSEITPYIFQVTFKKCQIRDVFTEAFIKAITIPESKVRQIEFKQIDIRADLLSEFIGEKKGFSQVVLKWDQNGVDGYLCKAPYKHSCLQLYFTNIDSVTKVQSLKKLLTLGFQFNAIFVNNSELDDQILADVIIPFLNSAEMKASNIHIQLYENKFTLKGLIQCLQQQEHIDIRETHKFGTDRRFDNEKLFLDLLKEKIRDAIGNSLVPSISGMELNTRILQKRHQNLLTDDEIYYMDVASHATTLFQFYAIIKNHCEKVREKMGNSNEYTGSYLGFKEIEEALAPFFLPKQLTIDSKPINKNKLENDRTSSSPSNSSESLTTTDIKPAEQVITYDELIKKHRETLESEAIQKLQSCEVYSAYSCIDATNALQSIKDILQNESVTNIGIRLSNLVTKNKNWVSVNVLEEIRKNWFLGIKEIRDKLALQDNVPVSSTLKINNELSKQSDDQKQCSSQLESDEKSVLIANDSNAIPGNIANIKYIYDVITQYQQATKKQHHADLFTFSYIDKFHPKNKLNEENYFSFICRLWNDLVVYKSESHLLTEDFKIFNNCITAQRMAWQIYMNDKQENNTNDIVRARPVL